MTPEVRGEQSDEIRARLEEARTNRERLFGELENLRAREQADGASEGITERIANVNRAVANADQHVAELTIALAGDFNAGYVIADRLGLTGVPVPVLFGGTAAVHFPTGESDLAVWGRTGSGVVNANALRVLVARWAR